MIKICLVVAGIGALSFAACTAIAGRPSGSDPFAERKQKLTPEQYRITQAAGTEPPFQNAFWNQHAPGIYVDVVSGEPLFSSVEKFDSGTGWPSFWQPLEAANVIEKTDGMLGMSRTEVRSLKADSHLGHVFDDGPKPTGRRYCINSAALRFVPAERLVAEGYGAYAARFPGIKQAAAPVDWPAGARAAAERNRTGVAPGLEVAVLGGGCFWGMQNLLRKLDGVVATEVGYAGGGERAADYYVISAGTTGHAESVRVVFDPKRLTYEKLLLYFFRIHDPTAVNRQENDVGTQYRSVIFAQSPEQLQLARGVRERVDRSGKVGGKVATEIAPAMPFFRAEEEHQDYLVKHPRGYNCHFVRNLDL